MPRGLFITLEGLDGSGKTTQINRLAAWLKKRGHASVVTRQPGGTATGDRIRELVLDSRSAGLAPMTEMALMFADRAQTIAEVILPALNAGKLVLCDRFTDSTEAYQGGGREPELGGSGSRRDAHGRPRTAAPPPAPRRPCRARAGARAAAGRPASRRALG